MHRVNNPTYCYTLGADSHRNSNTGSSHPDVGTNSEYRGDGLRQHQSNNGGHANGYFYTDSDAYS